MRGKKHYMEMENGCKYSLKHCIANFDCRGKYRNWYWVVQTCSGILSISGTLGDNFFNTSHHHHHQKMYLQKLGAAWAMPNCGYCQISLTDIYKSQTNIFFKLNIFIIYAFLRTAWFNMNFKSVYCTYRAVVRSMLYKTKHTEWSAE